MTTIMLQKLTFWAQQHQFLQKSCELYYILITNNNLVAKIDILSLVASIFAEMTYTTICSSCDNNYVVKIDLLISADSIFAEITWIIICWIMNNNYVAKIDVLNSAFSILSKSCESCCKIWCSELCDFNICRNHVKN